MKELLAKGTIDGKDIEVLCMSEGGKYSFLFNGKKDPALESMILDMLKQRQRTGNYSPKTKKLKICAIFDNCGFFDMSATEVEVFGDIEEIPFEEGVVY